MSLDELAKEVHANAVEKGFWDYMYNNSQPAYDPFIFYGKQLAMIHSEVSEVLEAIRKQKGDHIVVEELADIIIRVVDLYQGLLNNKEITLSLDTVLANKTAYNAKRPRLHGVRG